MKKDNCIFCKIIAGEIPSHTTYEDDNCKVILDISPATKGHSIIILKDHYDNFFELPEEKAMEVIKVAKIMSKKMADNLQCDGFQLYYRRGYLVLAYGFYMEREGFYHFS
jgi:histidine triad (HIT) family protein